MLPFRYATHLFEPSVLVETHNGNSGLDARKQEQHRAVPSRPSRHDSKLTAMMDDYPDDDYW